MVHFIEIGLAGREIYLFDLPDRRPESGASAATRWMFQMDVELLLYGNQQVTTGAVYRLLGRTPGAEGRALCLRHRSTAVSSGLCTEAEYDALRGKLPPSCRSSPTVPVETVVDA